MAITWTKNWGPADDGTLLKGIDIRNIQDDIDATGVSDATKIQGYPVDIPTVADDNKALIFDDAGQKFTYASLSGLPAGLGPLPFAGTSAPAGWLLCRGAAVSRVTYADLFAVVGVAFGVGDGATTFNLPDLRGRNVIGLDNMGGTPANRVTDVAADIVGGTSGAETKTSVTDGHTLTIAEMPSHTHPMNCNQGVAASNNDTIYNNQNALQTGDVNTDSTGGGGSHTHPITSFNVMNPFMATNWIIKT